MGFTIYPANNPNTGIGWTGTQVGSKTAMDVNIASSSSDSNANAASAAQGSDGVYLAKPAGANGDAVSAYASATTLTVTGLPFTFAQTDIVSIRQVPNAGGAEDQDTIFADVADFSVSGTTITVANASFAATDTFIVTLTNGIRSYDTSSDSKKTFETSPVWNQHIEETIADVTNETNATTNRYIDMDGYNHLTIQFEKTGGVDSVTLTVEGSLQDDGTAAGSVVYQDITQYGCDIQTAASTAASYTADAVISLTNATNYKYVKIKTVSAGGNNDADYAIYIKKWYS